MDTANIHGMEVIMFIEETLRMIAGMGWGRCISVDPWNTKANGSMERHKLS